MYFNGSLGLQTNGFYMCFYAVFATNFRENWVSEINVYHIEREKSVRKKALHNLKGSSNMAIHALYK